MAIMTQSVEVAAPVRTVYGQLTLFEAYPRFCEEVETVRQYDDTHLHWVARIGGRPLEWEVEIMQQEPDRCIAWYNLSGARSGGRIEVQALDGGHTRIVLTVDALPDPAAGLAAPDAAEIARHIERDLLGFRDFIEALGAESGAWRGEVHDGQVTLRGRDAASQGRR